jgi:hypothetical protein
VKGANAMKLRTSLRSRALIIEPQRDPGSRHQTNYVAADQDANKADALSPNLLMPIAVGRHRRQLSDSGTEPHVFAVVDVVR